MVASARFAREIDFCCFAVLMAAENEASIWVSSAPIAVKNTPRSRFISAHRQRSSDLWVSANRDNSVQSRIEEDPPGKKKKGTEKRTRSNSLLFMYAFFQRPIYQLTRKGEISRQDESE